MAAESLYEKLRARLAHVVPDVELRYKAEIAEEILRLKQEKHAVILAHNYMEPALFYSIPDFRGDSLDLSRKAAATDKDLIVFCGVRFMAETAKLLSPNKTVLLPSSKGGCSLAESITADQVRQLRELFPGAPVVSYVNTSAEVKAESDLCCTSSNAAAVLQSLRADRVVFLPDEYLARNVAREMGRRVAVVGPDDLEAGNAPHSAGIIGWRGRCEVHERFTVADVENARRQFPDVVVLAHPECHPDVIAAADFSGSTNAMIRFVDQSPAERFLVLTECAMADNVAAAHPDKEMVRMCSLRCPHMNEITLEDVRAALLKNQYVIEVAPSVADRARRAVEQMIRIG